MWLLRHSLLPKLAVTSFPTLCVITSMVYHPMAPNSACNTSNCYLWTQPSHRANYPSCVSIRSSSSPWAAATSHIQTYPSVIALLSVWIRRGRRRLLTPAFFSNGFSAYIDYCQQRPRVRNIKLTGRSFSFLARTTTSMEHGKRGYCA